MIIIYMDKSEPLGNNDIQIEHQYDGIHFNLHIWVLGTWGITFFCRVLNNRLRSSAHPYHPYKYNGIANTRGDVHYLPSIEKNIVREEGAFLPPLL